MRSVIGCVHAFCRRIMSRVVKTTTDRPRVPSFYWKSLNQTALQDVFDQQVQQDCTCDEKWHTQRPGTCATGLDCSACAAGLRLSTCATDLSCATGFSYIPCDLTDLSCDTAMQVSPGTTQAFCCRGSSSPYHSLHTSSAEKQLTRPRDYNYELPTFITSSNICTGTNNTNKSY